MYRQVVAEELSRSQFDAARLGFFQLLRRKRMSPHFIERHGEDLFGQACFEYSRQLSEGKKIDNPAAWIVTCGWHRTVGLLETRDWRPRMVSTEQLGELGEDEGTPEQDFLSEDRYRKVREAVERLPDHQRRLLALSYFEGESVREAARRLGWTASRAQRAHETARRRLHKLLGVEWSDELALEVGLAAFLSVGGAGCARHLQLVGGIEGALDAVAHPAELGHRVVDLFRAPFARGARPELGLRAIEVHRRSAAVIERAGQRLSEIGGRVFASGAAEGTAAAAEGGGRAVELCSKALAAVCLIGGGAVTGVLIGTGPRDGPHPPSHPPTVAVKAHPHREDSQDRVLAESQASEPAPETRAAPAPAATSTPQPAERHRSPEHHRPEPAVSRAKPPPSRPEGEFEPSPEAAPAEPEPEPVVEASTGLADAAKTTSSATSSSAGGAKPRPVPANSPEEFEP